MAELKFSCQGRYHILTHALRGTGFSRKRIDSFEPLIPEQWSRPNPKGLYFELQQNIEVYVSLQLTPKQQW